MKELPSTFKLVTVWLVVGTALFLAVQAWQAQRAAARFAMLGGAVELRRADDGHFHWPGRVGGVQVDFLVDTGATRTSLPLALAQQAGLPRGAGLRTQTANGQAEGYASLADVVLQGGVQAQALPVAVLPGLQTPLLGMDLLGRMRFSQQGGVLRLEPQETKENP